jgi:hypothetical protein
MLIGQGIRRLELRYSFSSPDDQQIKIGNLRLPNASILFQIGYNEPVNESNRSVWKVINPYCYIEDGFIMLKYWPFILWFIYFIFPFDLFPDVFPGIGWTDDFLILAYAYWMWQKKKQGYTNDFDPFSNSRETNEENSGSDHQSTYRPYSREPGRNPYTILGIERAASLDEIKRAYRLQASKYHPDKVSHLGEEFQALAKEKFQQIQQAYEQLIRENKAA